MDLLVSRENQLAGQPFFPTGSCYCIGTTRSPSGRHNPSTVQPGHSRRLVSVVFPAAAHILYPPCLSAHWRYQKFQIFKAVSVFSVYMLGFLMVHGQKRFSTSHTQTLVRFLFLASLYFVGPTQTATLRCSAQPYHGRTPHPCRYHG